MFLFRKPKKQVVMIHGFGRKLHHEFDPLAAFLKKAGKQPVLFDIYDVKDPEDNDYKTWIGRCEKAVKDALEKSPDTILLGFSMGGVIASYLATVYPVKKLILVAPAFRYLDLQKIGHYSIKTIKKITSSKDAVPPGSEQTKAFTDIVSHYKDSVYHIECPTLILHGTKDEVIPYDSSRAVYKNMICPRKLVLIEGGKHRMLYDKEGNEALCFELIDAMIEDRILK